VGIEVILLKYLNYIIISGHGGFGLVSLKFIDLYSANELHKTSPYMHHENFVVRCKVTCTSILYSETR
jgi:hypothetical protein